MIKISVLHQPYGHKLKPGKLLPKEIQYTALKSIIDPANARLQKAISEITCPTHGKHPKIINLVDTNRSYDITLDGCCKELLDTCQIVFDQINKSFKEIK
jgi:hypothetical protein